MRLLVTGASGLLGLNLALCAAREHAGKFTVFGTVNSHAIHCDDFTVIQTDLAQPGAIERLLDQTRPDWVIHCAALANVDACEGEPEKARQLNTELPAQLAGYVARGGARLVHISTDAVFDGKDGDYSEDDAPNPLGVYAQTKLAGERAVAAANPQAIIVRVNLFGWSLSGRRSLGEMFVDNLSRGQGAMGFTDVYFCPLLVNQLAPILFDMLARGLSGLYHVVGSECISKYAFGLAIARRFGLDASLITPTSVLDGGLVAARSPNLTLQTDRLTAALGYPPPDLSTGIDAFYSLYQQGYPQMIKALAAE